MAIHEIRLIDTDPFTPALVRPGPRRACRWRCAPGRTGCPAAPRRRPRGPHRRDTASAPSRPSAVGRIWDWPASPWLRTSASWALPPWSYCLSTGSWTTRLYDMAKASGYGESGKKTVKKVKVMVDGPYGTVLHFRIMNAGFDTIWD